MAQLTSSINDHTLQGSSPQHCEASCLCQAKSTPVLLQIYLSAISPTPFPYGHQPSQHPLHSDCDFVFCFTKKIEATRKK